MVNYQFIKYVKSRGIDPYTLNATQRQELKSDMIRDLYPGENTVASREYDCLMTSTISGLDKSPEIIQDTMLPDMSPEMAAESAVVVNRGYKEDHYAVSILSMYRVSP